MAGDYRKVDDLPLEIWRDLGIEDPLFSRNLPVDAKDITRKMPVTAQGWDPAAPHELCQGRRSSCLHTFSRSYMYGKSHSFLFHDHHNPCLCTSVICCNP
jgi:hypothetical protein